MTFNEILKTMSNEERGSMADQVLKRREYNRKYQARLRAVAKLKTLHKRIDENLDAVISYMHTHYADQYEAWTPPQPTEKINQSFKNWALLSANEYPSIENAFDLSGLGDRVKFVDFSRWFLKSYYKNDRGGYTKH